MNLSALQAQLLLASAARPETIERLSGLAE